MKWSTWLSVVLPLNGLAVLCAFDMYPWGKYDFKEYSADLLDGMREYEHLKVWDSALSRVFSDGSDSLLIKNSEGNTYELKAKAVGKALTTATAQMNDISAISAALQANCALLIDGYWSYEWCHMKEVRQFHLEQKDNLLHRGPDWSLGKQSKMVTVREKHDGDTVSEAKTRPVTKIIEYFENGQRCDETGEGRSTEVHIVCCEGTSIKNFISAAAYYANMENAAAQGGIRLPAATLASITEPDLCAYEVTVCSPLMCKRPSEVLAPASQVALIHSSAAQLAPIMKYINATCLTKQEDWWTYELCFNSGLRQVRYDIEQTTVDGVITQSQVLLNQYQLGVAPVHIYTDEHELKERISGSHRPEMSRTEQEIISDAGMVTPTFRTRGKEPRFLRLDMPDGTPCDLDAVNRSTVVDMYCGKKNRLVGIWEDSTCHYHVKVELPALCAFSDFVPHKENSTIIDFLPFGVEPEATIGDLFFDTDSSVQDASAETGDIILGVGAGVDAGAGAASETAFEGEEEWQSDSTASAAENSPEGVEATYEEEEEGAHPSNMPTITDHDEEHPSAQVEEACHRREGNEHLLREDLRRYTEEARSVPEHEQESDHADSQHTDISGAEDERVQQEPDSEKEEEDELYHVQHDLADLRTQFPDFDVVGLVMQLEAAAAELDQPLNLSRRAMVELIETAIAQTLDSADIDGVREEEGKQGQGGKSAPELVVKYAFVEVDGEDVVVLGSGEARDDRDGHVTHTPDGGGSETEDEDGAN